MPPSVVKQNVGKFARGAYTTSFEWKIKDYFKISEGADCRLVSPDIDCLDATWCLWLYPNGQTTPQSTEWMGLYVARKKSTIQEHCLNFMVGLKRNDGSILYSWNDTLKFTENNGHGWAQFFRLSLLNQARNTIELDGTLTIFCSMSVNNCEGVQAAVLKNPPAAVEKVVQDFRNLMVNEEASDVILNVKNRKFRVHSAVLVARSSVFAAMMKYEMKEKSSGVVEISDCDPDAFQVYLEYMYSGDMEKISTETVFGLHAIADKYDTEELKTTCIQFMMDRLSIGIFCDVLALAVRHNESELLEKAVMFFGRNLKDILVTVKWQSFVKENPLQANELYLKALDYYAKSDIKFLLIQGIQSEYISKKKEAYFHLQKRY